MSFLSRIFKRKVKNNINKDNKIELFIGKINNLLSEDKYIAKSEYIHLISEFKDTFDLFNTLKNTDMLSEYCNKNKIDKEHVNNFLMLYKDMLNNTFPININEHNKEFVKRHLQEDKKYLDNVLKDIDTNISLDNQQREAVLTDEDYSLIIAGAGAGIAMAGKTITKKARQKGVSGADAARFGNLTARAGEELTEQANDFQDASNGINGTVASLNMAQGSREFSGTNTITSLFINGTDATAWKTPIKITVVRFVPEIMGDLGHYTSFCDQYGWPVLNYGDLSVDGPYQMAGATCHADAPPGVLSTINSTINSLIIIE